MPIPDLLLSRHNGAGGAVFSLTGGTTLSQIGSTFTASVETLSTSSGFSTGSVIEFKGSRYVWHRNEIREENTGGAGTWGVVQTLVSMSSASGFSKRTGLFQVEKNGDNILVGMYINTLNSIGAVESVDGVTWTVNNVALPATTTMLRGNTITFKNKLYWKAVNTADGVFRYDPQTGTADRIALDNDISGARNHDFCVFDDTLFLIGSVGQTATGRFRLWRFESNSFRDMLLLNASNSGNGENGSCALFTDNTNLYAILPGRRDSDSMVGNTAFRLNTPTGTPTATDITAAILPAQFQPGGGSTTDNNRWYAYLNNANPAAIELFLWRLPNPSTGTFEGFQWQGDGATMTSLGVSDVSFIAGFYLPHTKFGGGERINSSGKIYGQIEQEQLLTASGEIVLSYRVYGSGPDVTLTLYYNSGQVPSSQATLTAASGGSSSLSAGTIIDVTPDDGATLYSMTWDAGSDGFSINNMPKLMIDVQ